MKSLLKNGLLIFAYRASGLRPAYICRASHSDALAVGAVDGGGPGFGLGGDR